MNFDSIASIVYSKKYCLSLEKTSLLFTVTIEDGAIESKLSVFSLLFYCTTTPSTIEDGAIESKASVFKLLFYYTDHTLSTIEKKQNFNLYKKLCFT